MLDGSKAFRNYTARPKAHEYTHVCKLCWPARAGNPSDDDPSEGSLANSGDEPGEPQNSPATASSVLGDLPLHTRWYSTRGRAEYSRGRLFSGRRNLSFCHCIWRLSSGRGTRKQLARPAPKKRLKVAQAADASGSPGSSPQGEVPVLSPETLQKLIRENELKEEKER